jgi:hypothetical protein
VICLAQSLYRSRNDPVIIFFVTKKHGALAALFRLINGELML